MPYQYHNFCHATLEQAVVDEFDNGVITAGSVVYSPVSYTLSANSAVINYAYDNNQIMTLTRYYPTCTDVGYPSITGLSLSEGIALNVAVITIWCIAHASRAVRRVL